MSLDVGFDAQVPSLPDAGGMTSSLGESFSSKPSTGTADFSIRNDTPHGPNDIGPRLALHYDSASGNSPSARLFDAAAHPAGAASVTFAWQLERIDDALVNATVFGWERDRQL
jgi:hypothetical protein